MTAAVRASLDSGEVNVTWRVVQDVKVLWYYLFSRLSHFRVFRAMADARI